MIEEKKNTVNFSDYVETYQKEIQSSINFIGQDVDFFIELKADILAGIAKKYFTNIETIRVLDIGGGIGLTDHHLRKYFKNLNGVDVEEDVVNKAREYNPEVNYSLYDGLKLPFDDNSMDLVFAINVMHHVRPENWKNFLKEMHRVLKPGGLGTVFEHNPLNPLTRLAVSKCEFDRDAVLIYRRHLKKMFSDTGFGIYESKYIVFFPFRHNVFRTAEKAFAKIPFGAQYYFAGKK